MSDIRDIRIENLASEASDKIVPWFIAANVDFGIGGITTTSETYGKMESDEIASSFLFDADTAFPELYIRLIFRGSIANASAEVYTRLFDPNNNGLCELHSASTSYTILDSGWVAFPSGLSGVGVWAVQMRTTNASYAATCTSTEVMIGYKMDN